MYRVKFEETVVSMSSAFNAGLIYAKKKRMKYKINIHKKVLWDGRGHSTRSEAECRSSSFQVSRVDTHLGLSIS